MTPSANKITNLEFIFSNKDRVSISTGWIPEIKVLGIKQNILQRFGTDMGFYYTCTCVEITIESTAVGQASDNYGNTLADTAISRVLQGGISRIVFTLNSGEKIKLVVPNYRFNWSQTVRKLRNGNILVRAYDRA